MLPRLNEQYSVSWDECLDWGPKIVILRRDYGFIKDLNWTIDISRKILILTTEDLNFCLAWNFSNSPRKYLF